MEITSFVFGPKFSLFLCSGCFPQVFLYLILLHMHRWPRSLCLVQSREFAVMLTTKRDSVLLFEGLINPFFALA